MNSKVYPFGDTSHSLPCFRILLREERGDGIWKQERRTHCGPASLEKEEGVRGPESGLTGDADQDGLGKQEAVAKGL